MPMYEIFRLRNLLFPIWITISITKDKHDLFSYTYSLFLRLILKKNPSVKKTQVQQDTRLAEAADTEDYLPTVPRYICPSSEDKSKEYMCKLWVARSKFAQASRTLPLM